MPWSEIYGQGAGSNSGEALRIRGVVLDTADPPAPLIGVSVIIKGTQKGVTTDTEGFFSIEAARGQTLLFSYMGYKDKEYAVTRNEASLTIALAEDNTALEEVVVLGMSSQQKTNIASSVGTIETSNFVGKPITQLSQELQGGTIGILVSQSSGLLGGDAATI